MKKRIRLLSLLLSVLLAACSAPAGESEQTASEAAGQNTPAAEASAPETDPEPDWYGSVPEGFSCDGYTFTALRYEDGTWKIYVAPEEMDGEVLNDAAYQRTLEVEDLLDVDVVEITDGGYESNFKKVVNAGEGETYDVICYWCPGERASYITGGFVYDWQALPNMDLTNDWYNQSANDAYRIAGKQYFAVSDLTFPVHQHFRILFNKELTKDLGLDYPYEAVMNGEWTFDLMLQYIKGVYADLDGNGKADLKDRYGIVLNPAFTSVFPINSGEIPVTCGPEGFEFNLYSDRIVRIVEGMQALVADPDAYFNAAGGNAQYEIFKAGNAIFEPYGSDPVLLRDLEFDFGYLPYPKFDEEQTDYVVWSAGGLMGVPICLTDPERTGAVLEALSAASARYVRDAFVEQYVEGKVLRDEESQIIYRMMREKATYDLSFNIDPSSRVGEYKYYSALVTSQKFTPASYWESSRKAIEKAFSKLFDQITEAGG